MNVGALVSIQDNAGMLLMRSTLLCSRVLRCLVLIWLGFVMPGLVQAERICDGLAHDAVHTEHRAISSSSDETDSHSGPMGHCKGGHCHSQLGHDQVDAPACVSSVAPAFRLTPTARFTPDYRSHIPSLPDRPPRA